MTSDDQMITTPEQVLRARQLSRIKDMIEHGGHRPVQTGLRIREQEDTDIM